MRASEFHLHTVKETPADAEIVSHKLMLRAGMIRKLTSGLYTWTPLGLRVLRRVEAVVREEMNRAGALEMLMPAVQPAELWEETGRWDDFGPLLLKISDRAEREYCFGPTHEEVVTDFARNEIKSYKQLPVNFYQIQMKFRDEIRPRFGVMRAREFLMKDAYSFHQDEASLAEDGYRVMYDAYTRIFTRLGLEFRAVEADSGAIGGKTSHEFHVLADSGEDAIAFSSGSDYAANVELAEAVAPTGERPAPGEEMRRVDTPGVRTIRQLVEEHGVPIERTVKTLVVESTDEVEGGYVALLVRGDHELNEVKAEKLPQVAAPLRFATEAEIRERVGAGPGSLGPVDLPMPDVADIRNVQAGDPSPDGKGELEIARGIEVGHVFQLGTKYSEAMNAVVLDESGKAVPLWMGCYGIGVSRIVAAAIEQNHDERGIIWPGPLAPFQVAILPINMHKSHRLKEAAEQLHDELVEAGLEVILDDRKARPGVMFAEQELIGIPHRVVLGDRGLDAGTVEYQGRADSESRDVSRDEIVDFLRRRVLDSGR